MLHVSDLKFNSEGLIPVVVVDYMTKKVLTVAYMNEESLRITLEEGKTCFWSRSRQKLWRKGETSGNYQHVMEIKADCDKDALVITVKKDGPACHKGTDSCFTNTFYRKSGYNDFSISALVNLLEDRKKNPPAGSYTSYLFEKGIDKILKKVGEESTEVIIAAKADDKKETVYEVADLVYHVLVMMVEMGISPEEVFTELASRHVIDHKVKQEKMT
ncbi:MAG: bifunctional phosphoribosyl-AMP cyclohydrolase/phosphoribosyl-ATP diphosphatase HisIE [Clostridia bacterium]|nr:bifunctional phosphoribosyl-AMP cyclohydrolase/phosphoribosyl-ATP diphosphatase HisIE [Clostridia bacterium]MBR6619194.1 bifunctional phosphoribosyl-AMP cyclohydrolase/phosphoribosyl-ATP diphosphatase HisIE [Clostridia bacterium]